MTDKTRSLRLPPTARRRVVSWLALVSLVLASPALGQDTDPARERYLVAREHLIEERLDDALQVFREVVRDHPDSDVADDAQYYVGYCLDRLGRDEEALQAFDRLLQKWPDSVRAGSARERRTELFARGNPTREPSLDWLLTSETSWEVRRDAAFAMARNGHLAAASILEEAMRRESTGRQIELARILAPLADRPEARRILLVGLEPSHSTSVQLQVLSSLGPATTDPAVGTAIAELLSAGTGISTSVQLKAIEVLRSRSDEPGARKALARALQPGGSTSVQMAAVSALEGHLLAREVLPSLLELLRPGGATSPQMKALQLLASENDDPALVQAIETALQSGVSTSVQLQAVRLARSSPRPEIRQAAAAALSGVSSTSVQLEALRALDTTDGAQSAAAIEAMMRDESVSTSVQLQALSTLGELPPSPASARAVASALEPERSTSVQLRALGLAVEMRETPEIRSALLRLLGESESSTSVQLRALELLARWDDDPEALAMVGKALQRSETSTSVQLAAVEILSRASELPEVRRWLLGVLHEERSTSVVLASIEALEDHVAESEVRAGLVRLMENDDMSSSARVDSARALLRLRDPALAPRIAEAMEDVVLRADRHLFGHISDDLVDDALDVLHEVDPQRAARLKKEID